jgi:hypothetical protein
LWISRHGAQGKPCGGERRHQGINRFIKDMGRLTLRFMIAMSSLMCAVVNVID